MVACYCYRGLFFPLTISTALASFNPFLYSKVIHQQSLGCMSIPICRSRFAMSFSYCSLFSIYPLSLSIFRGVVQYALKKYLFCIHKTIQEFLAHFFLHFLVTPLHFQGHLVKWPLPLNVTWILWKKRVSSTFSLWLSYCLICTLSITNYSRGFRVAGYGEPTSSCWSSTFLHSLTLGSPSSPFHYYRVFSVLAVFSFPSPHCLMYRRSPKPSVDRQFWSSLPSMWHPSDFIILSHSHLYFFPLSTLWYLYFSLNIGMLIGCLSLPWWQGWLQKFTRNHWFIFTTSFLMNP